MLPLGNRRLTAVTPGSSSPPLPSIRWAFSGQPFHGLRQPGCAIAAQRFGVVQVERDQGAKALRAMLSAARAMAAEGRPLVIFPEGTRVPHGTHAPLQAGFAGLYKLLGFPVVAVAVDSGPLYHRWLKRPGVITYRFAEPIAPGLPREEVEARVLAAINDLNPVASA